MTAAARTAGFLAACALFGALVTANSAGYRFGISDQAFYIPAVDLARDPSLFPRDRQLFAVQSGLTVIDESLAGLSEASDLGLEPLFFAGYLLTIGAFVAGTWLIGSRLYASSWAVAALLLALTLRHRIARTGVNTFEGYFHPRVFAFGIGLVAVGLVWRQRRAAAAVAALAAMLIHPTTGAWFAIWVAVAAVVAARPPWRLVAAAAGVALLGAAAIVASGALDARLVRMDPSWTATFADRDYLFPTDEWSPGTWAVNLVGPLLVAAGLWWRTRLRLVSDAERGVAAGALALLGVFLASLPLIAWQVALAVQLQTSRALWMLELLGTAYLVWMLAEAPRPAASRLRPVVLVALLAVASLGRGYYVLRVEHHNPLVRVRPEPSDWQRLGAWIQANTPVDAHLLADPGHVWPYGTSLRIVADRDVLTEDVKDTAIAIYGRDVAMRVRERRSAVGDFNVLTEAGALALARRYDLDYLIAERTLRLRLVHREGPLKLYSLEGPPPSAPARKPG